MAIPDKYALVGIPRPTQDASFDKHRAELVVVLWDRQAPINGVGRAHWVGRFDTPPDGDIYLIQDPQGHTIVFQPHHPSGGPMVNGEGQATGEDHADQIAAGRVAQELMPAPPRG